MSQSISNTTASSKERLSRNLKPVQSGIAAKLDVRAILDRGMLGDMVGQVGINVRPLFRG